MSSLVHAVGTDAELNEEEAQILKAMRSLWDLSNRGVGLGPLHGETAGRQVLGLVEDAHPDALACRCLVTLAVLRSGSPLPWDFRQEFAWYVPGTQLQKGVSVSDDFDYGS